jgi:hypothetical protein
MLLMVRQAGSGMRVSAAGRDAVAGVVRAMAPVRTAENSRNRRRV